MKNKINTIQKGYAILFAVVIISIISMIAIGMSNTTYKQLILSSVAANSQLAFFESDTATECSLYADNVDMIDPSNPPASWSCGLNSNGGDYFFAITPINATDYSLTPMTLGTGSEPCFEFTVTKDITVDPNTTKIKARGYNSCDKTNPRTVEREIEVNY